MQKWSEKYITNNLDFLSMFEFGEFYYISDLFKMTIFGFYAVHALQETYFEQKTFILIWSFIE